MTRCARTRLAWLVLVAHAACTRERAPTVAQHTKAAAAPVAVRAAAPERAPGDDPTAEAFTPAGPDGYGRAGELRYLEHVIGAAADAELPMVVVVHGLGDRPGMHWLDLVRVARPVRLIMPEAPTPHGDGFAWFPFRARSQDQAALADGIAKAEEALSHALAALERGRPTRGRPLVTGFSQGGMLAFALLVRHPERLALAVPIAGTLPEPLWPTRDAPAHAPKLIALHGTADELVPFEPTERAVEKLRARRYDATLVPYPGEGHHIGGAMRARVSEALNAALAEAPP